MTFSDVNWRLFAFCEHFPYSFAVGLADNISTDVAYSRGLSAVAELVVEQTNTLKRVNFTFIL